MEEPVELDIPMEDFGDRPEDPEQLGKWRAEILNSICEVCGKIFGVHSEEEHRVCAEKSRQKLIPPQK